MDFVLRQGTELFALEVKSGMHQGNVSGLDAFTTAHPGAPQRLHWCSVSADRWDTC